MTPEKVDVVHHLSESGLLEVYDLKTGRLLEVREKPLASRPATLNVKDSLTEYTLPDGRIILASHSLPLEAVEKYYEIDGGYNPAIGDVFCQLITEGKSMKSACSQLGVTYAQVCRWKRMSEKFGRQIVEAKIDRAEMLRDEVIDISDNVAEDSDAVAKARLQTESRKWSAGADSPLYSGKNKVETGAQGSVTIVISTGISREERAVTPAVEVISD